jgi:hypothetical protein
MDISSFVALVIVSCVVGVGIGYLVHQNRETKLSQWRSLAAAKKLTFTPGTWSLFGVTIASVQGEYKECYLALTTVQKSQGKSSVTYTQITVRPKHQVRDKLDPAKFPLGQPLTYHDLKIWLRGQGPSYSGGRLPITIEANGSAFVYEERGVITDNNFLGNLFDFLVELARTYPEVVSLGGEAVSALEQIASESSEELQAVAQQLLRDISAETQRLKLDNDWPFCPRCLTGCAPYEVSMGWWSSLTFYGCRTCRQSREFLKGSLIAVLDSQMEAEMETKRTEWQERVRVNWLRRRSLFDFSWVEIVQASDEEVERFAVQAGNDTDEWRKPRYERMPCTVSAQCQLSENTLRILERMFGEVGVEV